MTAYKMSTGLFDPGFQRLNDAGLYAANIGDDGISGQSWDNLLRQLAHSSYRSAENNQICLTNGLL